MEIHLSDVEEVIGKGRVAVTASNEAGNKGCPDHGDEEEKQKKGSYADTGR